MSCASLTLIVAVSFTLMDKDLRVDIPTATEVVSSLMDSFLEKHTRLVRCSINENKTSETFQAVLTFRRIAVPGFYSYDPDTVAALLIHAGYEIIKSGPNCVSSRCLTDNCPHCKWDENGIQAKWYCIVYSWEKEAKAAREATVKRVRDQCDSASAKRTKEDKTRPPPAAAGDTAAASGVVKGKEGEYCDLKLYPAEECVICQKDPPVVVYIPCGHVTTCTHCWSKRHAPPKSCELCRADIEISLAT